MNSNTLVHDTNRGKIKEKKNSYFIPTIDLSSKSKPTPANLPPDGIALYKRLSNGRANPVKRNPAHE